MKALLHKDNYELRINNYANVGDNKMPPNSSQEGKQHGITSNIIIPRIPLLGVVRGGFMILLIAICSLSGLTAQAQNNVGIGTTTPNSKAILELQATDKGLLVPRLTATEMNSIVAPPNGLLIYNTNDNCFNYFNAATTTWKSMCNISGIINSGDTVIINLLKSDSIFANYLQVDSAFINNLFAHYITADSGYIKNLISNYIKADSAYINLLRTDSIFTTYLQAHYIRTDSIYAGLGRFDSLVIKGLSIDSLIKQITTNYLNTKDTVVLQYLRTDSIYTHLLRADSTFINYIYAHSIQADTIRAGFGSFDSLYIGGQNILQTITDSIAAQAWLLNGNNTTATNKLGTLNTQPLHIYAGGTERMSIMNGTGNVGIGQPLPSAKLDVLGNIQFFGDLKPAGTAGTTGQVLTSAGAGVAPTWTSVNTLVPTTTNTLNTSGNIVTSTVNGIVDTALTVTSVSNTSSANNLNTTINGVVGTAVPIVNSLGNTYNTTTGAFNTTVNGIVGTNITLPTNKAIGDSVRTLAWLTKGNAGTTAGANFIGTTDNVDVVFKRNNVKAAILTFQLTTAFGVNALPNSSANANTAIGASALGSTTTGTQNTAVGVSSLFNNTVGTNNTALGFAAGNNYGTNASGIGNTLLGAYADAQLGNLTNATAIGYKCTVSASNSMILGGTGADAVNVGINTSAPANKLEIVHGTAGNSGLRLTSMTNAGVLSTNASGDVIKATTPNPANAMFWGLTGNSGTNSTNFIGTTDNINVVFKRGGVQSGLLGSNTSFGVGALNTANTGILNVAIGYESMPINTTGRWNTAYGYHSLIDNTSGEGNTSIGHLSGGGNVTGANNTYLGYYASAIAGASNLSNSCAIGYSTNVNASNKLRLGNSSVTVIEGQVAYSFPSDGRFKTITNNEVKGLEFITKLRPVIYTFDTRKFDEFLMKNMPDSTKQKRMAGNDYSTSSTIIHTGFIAQEIEKAAKESGFIFDGVHTPENDNDNYSVAYSQFVVPLVKAVQELNEKNKTYETEIKLLNTNHYKQIELLLKRIEALEKKTLILNAK